MLSIRRRIRILILLRTRTILIMRILRAMDMGTHMRIMGNLITLSMDMGIRRVRR